MDLQRATPWHLEAQHLHSMENIIQILHICTTFQFHNHKPEINQPKSAPKPFKSGFNPIHYLFIYSSNKTPPMLVSLMSHGNEWFFNDLQVFFYLLHKVLNTGTISSKPIHVNLPQHYCYLHSRNLHGSCTCRSKISWHHHEESPNKQSRCKEKRYERLISGALWDDVKYWSWPTYKNIPRGISTF